MTTYNRRWNLVATDPPVWWMLDLESDPDDPLLRVVKDAGFTWRVGLTGPTYSRLLLRPDEVEEIPEAASDQARWVGLA